MGVIRNKVTLAAGASNNNILAGSAYEFINGPTLVEIGLLASATGLLATVQSGTDVLLETDSAVDVVRVANQGPVYPDDFILRDGATAGDRLKIGARNPTAAAIDLFYSVRTTPADG